MFTSSSFFDRIDYGEDIMKCKVLFLVLLFFMLWLPVKGVLAAEISEGIYTIESAFGKNVETSTNPVTNESTIQINEFSNEDNQKWYFKDTGDGYYYISSVLDSSMNIDVKWGNNIPGTLAQMYYANNTISQEWMLKSAGDGYYYLIARCNNLYLDVSGGNQKNGTKLQLWSGNNTDSQKFLIKEVIQPEQTIEDGDYVIHSALNDKMVIDVSGGKTSNYTNVQLYERLNYTNFSQMWHVTYLGDGYYSFSTLLNENKLLDLNNGFEINGGNIQIFDGNNTDSQKFVIKDVGDGYYSILTSNNYKYVDVSGGLTSNGTNIQVYQGNGTDSQKFRFEKIEFSTLEDGIYTINSSLDNNKVISINNSVASNMSSIQLSTNNNENNQKWYIKNLGNDVYSITSIINQNRALDVEWGIAANKTSIWLYNSNDTLSQKWYIKYVGNGYYSIITQNGGYYMDIDNGQVTDGTRVQIYEENNSGSQKFSFTKTEYNPYSRSYEDGYYTISSLINLNKSIDASGGYKKNGTNVQIYSNNNTLSQIWYLKYLGEGYYSITSSMNPNVSLDVEGSGMSNGTNVSLYRYSGGDNQQWLLRDYGDGVVSIISKVNGLYLDVAGGSDKNGTNIQVYSGNGSNAQKFKLNEYTGQKIYNGIDVSHHQNVINWDQMSGIDFVIIRAGYGGNWTNQDDKEFLRNVEYCDKYNIPYGLYLYSYADEITSGEHTAENEAEHMLRLLKQIDSYNYKPTLGTEVFIDMEENENLDKERLTKIADTYCTTIENNGYNCGVYASANWLTNKLDAPYLASKYDIWVAQWPGINDFLTATLTRPSYNLTSYKYWQFSNIGNVSGIGGNVDLDLGYDIFD